MDVERISNIMPEEALQNQQFQHTMTTLFTCRSVIKYNSTLNDEQKSELIQDIDKTLQFLRGNQAADLSSHQFAEIEMSPSLTTGTTPDREVLDASTGLERGLAGPSSEENSNVQETLQALYRIYHAYLSAQHNNSIATFFTRFKEAMAAINEAQNILERSHNDYIPTANPLQQVSTLISYLHTIFIK